MNGNEIKTLVWDFYEPFVTLVWVKMAAKMAAKLTKYMYHKNDLKVCCEGQNY